MNESECILAKDGSPKANPKHMEKTISNAGVPANHSAWLYKFLVSLHNGGLDVEPSLSLLKDFCQTYELDEPEWIRAVDHQKAV